MFAFLPLIRKLNENKTKGLSFTELLLRNLFVIPLLSTKTALQMIFFQAACETNLEDQEQLSFKHTPSSKKIHSIV